MNREEIDLSALLDLIHKTEAEIRPIKRALRSPWTRPMATEQGTLCSLRLRATRLYVLRASLRGHRHLPLDEAEHRELAEDTAERYRLRRPAQGVA